MSEENFIDFKCPHCGEMVSFPQEFVGHVQECPLCAENCIVPADGSGLGRAIPIPVTTERLVLRRLHPADWKDLLEYLSDEELFQCTEGRPLSEEEIIHWLQSDAHVRLTTPGQAFYLGVQLQAGGKLIGHLSLHFTEPHRAQAAVNLMIGRSHQRQGYGAEALAGGLRFGFEDLRLHRLTASCDTRNTAARALFERAGLRREGEFLKDHFTNGEWASTVAYALIEEDCAETGSAPAA